MGKYLGIDASTQSISGLLIDTEAGAIIAEESIKFDAHFHDSYGVEIGVFTMGGGTVHSAPLMWAEALDLLLQPLSAQGCDLGQIQAIAGSGQQHGTVYLNATAASALGNLSADKSLKDQLAGIFSRETAPIWMDTSTAAQCAEIEAGVGGRDALLELTGNTAFERFSGPQIRKFHQTEPTNYTNTSYIGLVSSYVASLLAGTLVGVAPGAGERAADAAARCRRSTECLVLPSSGDTPCSLIGLGLVTPGQVALSLGTSDTLFACMDQPRTSKEGEGAVFASPDGQHYMALTCYLNGSLAREAARDEYGLDWDGFTAALQATPPGNDGGLMLPYFAPEIVPNVPEAHVVRHHLDAANAQANVRAIIEAQALSSAIHARWMGVDITSIYVTGGASANAEILRVYANVHNCPIHRFETTNSAALGAALRAAHGHTPANSWQETVGPFTQPVPGSTIEPDGEAVAAYRNIVGTYETLAQTHTNN